MFLYTTYEIITKKLNKKDNYTTQLRKNNTNWDWTKNDSLIHRRIDSTDNLNNF